MIGQLLIERYLVLEQLGSGGFSRTYLVRDKYLPDHPLCVVKCLYLDDPSILPPESAQCLFKREAQILHELGRNHSQLPWLLAYVEENTDLYLVLEYIDGKPLENWIGQNQLFSENEVTALLYDILSVVDYIHSQNIIHQDIKPSNLIRRHSDGKIALIDFGAATHPNDILQQDVTFGTSGYIPLEQKAGASTFNSDLYALGVTAIQLLTGIHPQQFKRHPLSQEIDWHSYLKKNKLNKGLIAILDKMVCQHSGDRYTSASAALNDLHQLSHRSQPISKTSNNPISHRSLKSIRRNLALASMIILVVGAIKINLIQHLPKIKSILAEQLPRIPTLLSSEASLKLLNDIPVPHSTQQMVITTSQILVTGNSEYQIDLWNIHQGTKLKTLTGHSDTITNLIASQDGKWLVSNGKDHRAFLWKLPPGRQFSVLLNSDRQPITSVAISPDSQLLATSTKPHTMQIWNLQSGQLMQTIRMEEDTPQDGEETITSIDFSPTNLLICSTNNNRIMVWKPQDGHLQQVFAGHTRSIKHLQVSSSEPILYSFGQDRALAWNLETAELVRVFPPESAQVSSAALHDRHLITIHTDGTVRSWDRTTGQLVKTITRLNGLSALSPDGKYLANYGSNQRLKIWQLEFNKD